MVWVNGIQLFYHHLRQFTTDVVVNCDEKSFYCTDLSNYKICFNKSCFLVMHCKTFTAIIYEFL